MPRELPSWIPEQLFLGQSYEFKVYHSDFLPADGYTAVLYLRSANGRQDLTSSDNGDGWHKFQGNEFSVTGAGNAGGYRWMLVYESGSEEHVRGRGRLQVRPDLTDSLDVDDRSHAETVLEAIEATLEGKATKDQQSYTISTGGGSRSLSRLSWDELLAAKGRYEQIVQNELSDDEGFSGRSRRRRFLSKFEKAS